MNAISPQDPSDGIFRTAGGEIYASFIPAANLGANPLVSSSQAVASTGAQIGPSSLVSVVSGGIIINLLFDAAAMAAPASFRAGIQQAATILGAAISDKITVNINIDYSGTGGGAAAGPDHGLFESYPSIKADLISNATPGDTIFSALPSGPSIQGQSNAAVWNAQLKLWGLLGANDASTDDGSATFATDINPNLLVGVALHELTHALGRVPYGPEPDIFDLFRFTSPGTQLFANGNIAPASYFSVDGGNTKLADFGQNSDPSDFLNRGVQGANDPFNEFYTGSTSQSLSTIDKELLDALGFHTTSAASTVIEAFGSTSLVQVGNNFYLNSNSSGSGPELKYGGAPVAAGQFSTWVPIGAEPTASGFEVAWKVAGADQYTVWSTDSSGNYISNIGVVSGTSSALEALETSFHQDLNGDGVIGIPTPIVIEAFGATSLIEVGNNFYLSSNSSGSGPELKNAGAGVVAGQAGAWTPVGAEQTATGYEVAWKVAGADQYSIWNTDSSGNYISNAIGVFSGTSSTLESFEASFHQDLNGDGVIGFPTTVIEANGSTSLTEIANNFYLHNSSGLGPSLKYAGVDYVAGQSGTWAPIGAEITSTGYEVAWKMAGADQYSVWSTDSNGNYVSNLIGAVSGTSTLLKSFETSFHQDLNGDGVISVPVAPTTVIEALGSTSLAEVGNNFYLNSNSSGAGPALKYAGATVTAGQFGGWTPIGAEQTATGYVVAWKIPGTDQYSVWDTDSNGNYIANAIGGVSGSSSTLESFETSFHQDLNGDGVIGLVAHSAPAQAAPINAVAGPNHTSSTASSSILVEFGRPSNDTFVFHTADASVDVTSTAEFEPLGFSSVSNTILSMPLSNDAQSELSQSLLQFVSGARDNLAHPGDHESLNPVHLPMAELNTGGFIIH
jgi:serralysin